MEYQIETTEENRDEIIELLHPYGFVVDRWPDGTFNFSFYNAQCVDEGTEDLDERGIENKLL